MGALPAETGETPPPSDGTLGHNDAPPKDQEKQRVLWSEMCDDESGEFEEVKQKKKRQRRGRTRELVMVVVQKKAQEKVQKAQKA